MLNYWSGDHHWPLWTKDPDCLSPACVPLFSHIPPSSGPCIYVMLCSHSLSPSIHQVDCRCSHPTCSLDICYTRPCIIILLINLLSFSCLHLRSLPLPPRTNPVTLTTWLGEKTAAEWTSAARYKMRPFFSNVPPEKSFSGREATFMLNTSWVSSVLL